MQVYSDLEVAFVVSENKTFLDAFAKAGELTYGRTAVSSQFYYGCLLHELLSFQLPDRHVTAEVGWLPDLDVVAVYPFWFSQIFL